MITSGIYGHTYVMQGRETKCWISGELAKDGMHWQNIRVMGKATCSPEDTYDEEFGKDLAHSRALQKFYKRYEKEMIRYSYHNTRKKIRIFDLIPPIVESLDRCVLGIGKRFYKLQEVKNDK